MLGELALFSSRWLLGVRKTFRYEKHGDISSNLKDTPWDEPTTRSYEFGRYVSGLFIDDAPWNRIPASVFCSSSITMHLLSWLTCYRVALITGLLAVDPQDRMTLADAFQHPWVLTYVP